VGRFAVLTFLIAILVANFAFVGSAQAQDVTKVDGLWSGTTRVMPPCLFTAGRCDAVNNVTFRLMQNGKRIKGKFTCAYGNMICRNGGADNSGKIVSGKIAANQIRLTVVLPADVSNCYYNGVFTSATAVRGAYSCYEGGELIEEGMWNATRSTDP
jgi:hypothetical protein